MNYDPNLTCSGRMADQTVEMTFQQWEYTMTKTAVVGGNCRGLSIIECAVENLFDELGGEDGEITLTNANGDTLSCELWETKLEDLLVGARILSITPQAEEPASR